MKIYEPNADGDQIQSFVLNILDGKKNGTFVEIGAYHSDYKSNTKFLEEEFGWSGLAIEINPKRTKQYNENRKSKCIESDALTFNYQKYFEENNFPKQIDFLQIDIDHGYNKPSENGENFWIKQSKYANYFALISLPIFLYRFTVIYIEHMNMMSPQFEEVMQAQRKLLTELGYTLTYRDYNDDLWVDSRIVPTNDAMWYMGSRPVRLIDLGNNLHPEEFANY